MFRDRDLIVLAAGAVAGILTLFLPFSLVVRAMIAGAVFVFSMVLALARFGPDRLPIEQLLARRIRYARSTRRYVYRRHTPPSATAPEPERPPPPPKPAAQPVVFAVEEVGIEPVLTAALAVLGAYLAYWLYTGGGEELGNMIRLLLR